MSRLPLKDLPVSPFRKALANAPKVYDAFVQMEKSLSEVLDPELMELIRLRSAANNGCEF